MRFDTLFSLESYWKVRMSKFLDTILIITVVAMVERSSANTSSTVVLVHSIFRHGDRTPAKVGKYGEYPTDPYINATYYPYGYGQLVNRGKRREYDLGSTLRERYDDLLGDLYFPPHVDARSTDVNRTKMSLQLVLASLYPPKGQETWLPFPSLNWQPIPYNYEPLERDELLGGLVYCPKALKYINKDEVKKIEEKYEDALNYVKENTGWKSVGVIKGILLYSTLTAQKEWGFVLPAWTAEVYPEPLRTVTADLYQILTGNDQLKQVTGGALLRKILDDTVLKIQGKKDTKIFLYSGHDYTVANMLNTLGVFKPHVPPYGSCIIFEVHQVNGQYGIKIFYENYEDIQTGYLSIPNCEEFCPLDKFISLVKKYFPTEELCDGDDDYKKHSVAYIMDYLSEP